MPRKTLAVRPIPGGMSTGTPSLYQSVATSPYVQNCRVDQNSLKKRPGYSLYRSLTSPVYSINLYQTYAGSRFTLCLTDTDLCSLETSGTFSYKTETNTTPVVTSMNVGKTVITFSGGGITASGVAAGDKFIIDADHTATSEIDANWATVLTNDSDTQITLSAAYTGAATTGSCKLRKVYSLPTDERWSTAVVNDKFVFTNGNVDVQYYAGTGYAASLNSVSATNARYCIEYANRLIMADYYVSGIRAPYGWAWSKENDPTDWTDTTAGSADLLETEGYITGLGKTGGSLVLFKQDNLYVYDRTGISTSPFTKTVERRGVGCVAPYSIAEFMGTTAFIGRDDFYIMDGDSPTSIGEPIRSYFFDNVGDTEVKKSFSLVNQNLNEAMWVATTSSGKMIFVYNYKHQEWSVYTLAADCMSLGRGVV